MKTLKIATVATVLTALVITLCGILMTASASAEPVYHIVGVVMEMTQLKPDLWEITAIDYGGDSWSWYDSKMGHIGDLVQLKMIYDEVIDVELLGKLTPVGIALWFEEE